MNRIRVFWLAQLLGVLFAAEVWAGGSGLNVVIVVNQNSTNSVQLGNYYRAQRNVPPENFLRINWAGGNVEWSFTDFTNTLLGPLQAMLAGRQLTNQIDYAVLSMDIPYRVNNGTNYYNSTTSALFYGFKNDPNWPSGCEIADGTTNLYAASEGIFRSTPPTSPSSNSFLVTMITGNTLADAEMAARQGVLSDGTFPTQTVWLSKSDDEDRNVRFYAFDNTVFDSRLRGNYSVARTNTTETSTAYAYFSSQILGLQAGAAYYYLSPIPLFVPGGMADSLTSFGGQLFEASGQTSLLGFIAGGAAGSYGTVIEPCNYPDKFPDPQNYFYQSRGFSLAECYYQSVTNPYQGVVVGEPLAAPFAQPATGAWAGLASNVIIAGTTNLSVQFAASDGQHPLQQLDLFVDGHWLQTVTNIPPQSGDLLRVSLNGFATNYTVPTNATIKSVVSNLVNVLNGAGYQNSSEVLATAHGDRIELQSIAAYTKTGAQISISVSSTNPSAPPVTFIRTAAGSATNFLDSIAAGLKSYEVTGSVALNSVLTFKFTKTNNSVVTVSVTNTVSTNTPANFTLQLMAAVSNTVSLQGADGVTAEDFQESPDGSQGYFNLLANTPGYAAAQFKADLTGSPGISIIPTGTNTLTDNSDDLEPREHVYVTAGVTNLAATFSFITTNFADGYHELEAVAYEGSHVHTQARATQTVVIQNTDLSATLTAFLAASNSSLQAALELAVVASPTNISTIKLFSTGGLLLAVTNQASATFTVPLTTLGAGLHPFYALVTDTLGRQYRTATQDIGLVGVTYGGTNLIGIDLSFPVQATGLPPVLVWPATAGRSYEVQSTTNLVSPFLPCAIVIPTNSLGQWTETNTGPMQQFYRISVTP